MGTLIRASHPTALSVWVRPIASAVSSAQRGHGNSKALERVWAFDKQIQRCVGWVPGAEPVLRRWGHPQLWVTGRLATSGCTWSRERDEPSRVSQRR